MKKTLLTFLVLSILVFGFGMVALADRNDTVVCMALHCPKPTPNVNDDIVVCMALNCPKLPVKEKQLEKKLKEKNKASRKLNINHVKHKRF
jgi:hypothetical protein